MLDEEGELSFNDSHFMSSEENFIDVNTEVGGFEMPLDDEIELLPDSPRISTTSAGVMQFLRPFTKSKDVIADMPDIWPDWKSLEKQKIVKFKSNKLCSIPDSFHKLKAVEELRITRNKFKPGKGLSAIPSSISKLNMLKILDLRGNPLKEIPFLSSGLSSLKELILESCHLTNIPEITKIPNLERLILDNNEISIAIFCTNSLISYLSVVNNRIEDFPTKLPLNLTTLNLSENAIVSVPDTFPSRNSNLTKLYLRENRLNCLPDTLISLKQLKVLDVSKNCLRYLPEDIGVLQSLVNLNVSYNLLTMLPNSIIKLSESKTNLLCGENPLQKPPIEVGLKGLSSIVNYFKALDNSEEIRNKRLKLMLLGDGRAGKTFLAKALSTYKEPEKSSDETIGIDSYHMRITVNDNSLLEVLILDCAGQKKYMLTHQIFLSMGTIFAVVVNLSAYESGDRQFNDKIGYWIDLIFAKVPNATVLIIPTHLDLIENEDVVAEKCKDIVERADIHLKQRSEYNISPDSRTSQNINANLPTCLKFNRFGDPTQNKVEKVINTNDDTNAIYLVPISSCFTLPGLALLREEIVKIANRKDLCPHIHRSIPESWKKLEEFCVEERLKRFKTKEHLIMTVEEVEGEAQCLCQGEDYKEPLRFIDSMGHIIFFESESTDLVLLNPRWLFDLMKLLFTHTPERSFLYRTEYSTKFDIYEPEFLQARARLMNSALLSKHLLQCIWCDFVTDDKLFYQVLTLFKRFDLFYKVNNITEPGNDHYLVSWFLKDECPVDFKKTEVGKDVIVTRFGTIGSPLPTSFFQRFIIRVYAEGVLDKCFPWNFGFKGVVSDGDLVCELIQSEYSSVIFFRAYSSPENIYHMWKTIVAVLNVLEIFLEDWKGVMYSIHSVCPSCHKSGKQPPSVWRLDPKKWEEGIQRPLYCEQEGGERLDIWKIYPPPCMLEGQFYPQLEERMNKADMEDDLSFKIINRISEFLSTNVTALQSVFDVILGEDASSLDSRNKVHEIIKLWQKKSEIASKKHFIGALKEIRPYPYKVIEILIE